MHMTTCRKKVMDVKIVTSDAKVFLVPPEIAAKSGVIEKMIDMVDDGQVIPLQEIDSDAFVRVLEYLKTDAFQAPESDEDLLAVVVAANFLDVKTLLDTACQEVADRIKGKSPEEIRQIFGLENTYTPEEEAKVRQANAWAFE
jgi:S-phase kinase-associated protein 1